MTIIDDTPEEPPPRDALVEAVRSIVTRAFARARTARSALVFALVVAVAFLASVTDGPTAGAPQRPSASVVGPVPNPTRTVLDLAYVRAVAPTSAVTHDLVFTLTAGPYAQSQGGSERLTYVFRADLASGRVELLSRWPAQLRDALVFPAASQELMVVSSESGLALVRGGHTQVLGPALRVSSVLFLGPDDDPAARVVATTFDAVMDVTRPDRVRAREDTIAEIGGVLLGRLDDGRMVLASTVEDDVLVVRTVGIEGAIAMLGRIGQALGPAALARGDSSGYRVLVLRYMTDRAGLRVVSALDLRRGLYTDLEVIGPDGTFAARPRTHSYVFAQRPYTSLSLRGADLAPIQFPDQGYARLDVLRAWSPDGAQIAFVTEDQAGRPRGLLVYASDGRLLWDLALSAGVPVTQPTTIAVAGWSKRP